MNKKWLLIIAGIIFFILAAVYVLLFTGPGNRLLAPIIEKKINLATGLPANLEKFELRTGHFSVVLLFGQDNRIEAEGNFGLFSRNLQAAYRVLFNDLAALQPLTKTTLSGKFRTDGTVTGRFDDLIITGSSDIAGGKTTYSVKLVSFAPGSIKAEIKDAEAAQLLEMLGKKPFSRAGISLDLDFRNLDPEALDGNGVLSVSNGTVDTKLMKEEFDLSLPETSYTIKVTSRLEGRAASYTASVESNLARLSSEGSVAPESLETDINYEVDVKELALFKPLTDLPLRGPFKTSGTVKGNRQQMAVAGKSDIAASKTSYDITLADLKASKVLVRMSDGELAKLLYMAGQPEFASGNLNLDLTLTDLDPENLKGGAELKISNGKVVSSVFKKEYDISMPQTTFTCGLNAALKGEEISYQAKFDSDLAGVDSQGNIVPKNLGMDLNYNVDITRLELLQPFVGMPLRGALKLNGTAKGERKLLNVEGTSDLAGGKTTFKIALKDLAPASITAKIVNLQLAGILNMLAKPHYGDGTLNGEINIADAKPGSLKGSITTEISQGRLDGKVISKEFEFGEMVKTTFSGKTNTTLAGNFVDTVITFNSTLADLKVNRLRYNVKDSILAGDYRADIADLDRLYFATGRHLKGSMTVTGDLEKGEHLKLTAHSDTLGGKIDFKVSDDDVHGDLKKIQTLDTLKMLVYPEIFASSLDGTLDYNLARKKGLFSAKLSDGKFTQNIMLDLLLTLAKTDLYKERFNGTLDSRINGEQIASDLDLRSNSSSISGKNVVLNSKTKLIDAKLDVVANNNPIGVTIKGKVDKPDVKLDTSALIKKEATKAIEKEVNKLFKGLFK